MISTLTWFKLKYNLRRQLVVDWTHVQHCKDKLNISFNNDHVFVSVFTI